MLAGLQELVQFENKLCSSFASFFLGLLFGFLWLRGFYFVAVRPAVAGSRRRDGTGRSRSINLWWLVVFASSCWTCIFFPCPLAVFFIHTGVLGMMPVGRATQMQALLDVCEECGDFIWVGDRFKRADRCCPAGTAAIFLEPKTVITRIREISGNN